MGEYLKFWLAKAAVEIGITLAVLAAFLICALWSLRGQKFYKEPKK